MLACGVAATFALFVFSSSLTSYDLRCSFFPFRRSSSLLLMPVLLLDASHHWRHGVSIAPTSARTSKENHPILRAQRCQRCYRVILAHFDFGKRFDVWRPRCEIKDRDLVLNTVTTCSSSAAYYQNTRSIASESCGVERVRCCRRQTRTHTRTRGIRDILFAFDSVGRDIRSVCAQEAQLQLRSLRIALEYTKQQCRESSIGGGGG